MSESRKTKKGFWISGDLDEGIDLYLRLDNCSSRSEFVENALRFYIGYDAAEGLLTSVILMLAEFLPPDEAHPQERRHIVSVFKLVQDLLEPSVTGRSHFQILMGKLPHNHKAKWFAGAALNSAEQAMASVMSTVLSRLNAFLDSELE